MINKPILFLVFNRPDTTREVFEVIRKVQPKELFIAADGPREDKVGEKELCEEVKKIVSFVNWDCEVKTLFRENNLGCGKAVSGAINWFFENVEEGIILEDDCLPSISFFTYCSELLEKYRDNNGIYVISGNQFLTNRGEQNSYYYSAYGHIWGWATWRRAWKIYDFTLQHVNDESLYKNLKYYFAKRSIRKFWYEKYQNMKYNPIDTWDYQWMFVVWNKKGINILPNVNLVQNIGFGHNATHTISETSSLSNINANEIRKIQHPNSIILNKYADERTSIDIYDINDSFLKSAKNNLTYLAKKILNLFTKS